MSRFTLISPLLLCLLVPVPGQPAQAQNPLQPPYQNEPPGNFPPPPGMQPMGSPNSPSGFPGFGDQMPQQSPGGQDGQPRRQNFADELTDFGVPPQDQMQPNVGSPTPTTIPGGHVITTAEMVKAAEIGIVVVDVLEGPPHPGIPGALLMPGAGTAGSFSDPIQTQLWNALKQASGMNPARPLAFVCAGSRCWESYNAALRAQKMGFKMVLWYRGGLAAWQAAGLPMTGSSGGQPQMPPPASEGPGFGNPG